MHPFGVTMIVNSWEPISGAWKPVFASGKDLRNPGIDNPPTVFLIQFDIRGIGKKVIFAKVE
jgi:hypothetical protein